MQPTIPLVVALGTAFTWLGLAHGQCALDWHSGDGLAGTNQSVYAATTWDPDGDGPMEDVLVVGGLFTIAGQSMADHVAVWDGATWNPLGGGMDKGVRALAVYNGDLIAGGYFTTAGGVSAHSIARWDGANWAPLGDGMDDNVEALLVHDGDLIAGGVFTTAGGVPADSIARWDGSSWSPLGTGMWGGPTPGCMHWRNTTGT